MSAVADAGPRIHLARIDHLAVLGALFGEVLVPEVVHKEVLRAPRRVSGMDALHSAFDSNWLVVRTVVDVDAVAALSSRLDRGESEAIVLMREAAAEAFLVDDRMARSVARVEELPVIGTVGVLRSARDRGFIPSVTPLLAELRRCGFRISESIVEEIRREELGRP